MADPTNCNGPNPCFASLPFLVARQRPSIFRLYVAAGRHPQLLILSLPSTATHSSFFFRKKGSGISPSRKFFQSHIAIGTLSTVSDMITVLYIRVLLWVKVCNWLVPPSSKAFPPTLSGLDIQEHLKWDTAISRITLLAETVVFYVVSHAGTGDSSCRATFRKILLSEPQPYILSTCSVS
jgi:hypothetical protein